MFICLSVSASEDPPPLKYDFRAWAVDNFQLFGKPKTLKRRTKLDFTKTHLPHRLPLLISGFIWSMFALFCHDTQEHSLYLFVQETTYGGTWHGRCVRWPDTGDSTRRRESARSWNARVDRTKSPYVPFFLSFLLSFFLGAKRKFLLGRRSRDLMESCLHRHGRAEPPPPLNTHCPDPDHVMGSTLSCDGITCWGARLAFTLTKRTCLFPAQCVWCGVDATFDARAAEIHLTGATLCKNHDFNFQTLRKSMVKLMAVNFYHPDAWGYKEKKREFSWTARDVSHA